MWRHPERHPGEYLLERFMKPLGLTVSELARRCHIPRSRVSDIVAGKRRISADTAARLAALFRMAPQDWLALQAEWDLAQVDTDARIEPLDPPGFLVGPAGATPLPQPLRSRRPVLQVPLDAATQPERRAEEPSTHQEVRYADGTRALVVKAS